MRVEEFTSSFVSFVPSSIKIIGHDIKEVHTFLHSPNVKVLQVPERGRQSYTKTISTTSSFECHFDIL